MAYEISLDQTALDDIAKIYDYYEDTKFVVRFQIQFNGLLTLLELFPKMGAILDDADDIYYKWIIAKRFAVIYEFSDGEVEITHIFDGRTDYDFN